MSRSTRSFRRGLTLGLTFALCLVMGASLALAQDAQPEGPSANPSSSPAAGPSPVGELLVHDPLTGPGIAQAGACPTRAGAGVFVGEGFLLKLAGRCFEGDRAAGLSQIIHDLQFLDGQVKVEIRAVNGAERAVFGLAFREQADSKSGYAVAIAPTRGLVDLSLISDGQRKSLAFRSDLGPLLTSAEWISLAVVSDGPKLWVVLNDQPVLGVSDTTLERGGVRFWLERLGDANGDQETAVVLRDFRLSSLASGDQARAPTYEPQAPRVAQPGPPRIGRVGFSDAADLERAFESDRTVFSRNVKGLWAFYEWRDLPPDTPITTYWIRPRSTVGSSDSIFQRRSETKPWPSGLARDALGIFNFAGPDLRVGSYIFVVELDGVEVARREVTIR